MRLTKKLFSFLNGVFNKTPDSFLAIRLRYTGPMTWRIADATLYTTVVGGPGQNLTIDLKAYRLADLVLFLAAQPGYSVAYADTTELSTLSARVLVDGAGNIDSSNGDYLNGYTSGLWALIESFANELAQAEEQIVQMLRQMSTRTASNEWLDELGGYYGVPRLAAEFDANYSARIIAEVLRPRGNNVAMQNAIREFTGQIATVRDVTLYGATTPLYNGAITHNGAYLYNASAAPLYGLFDVDYGYDLLNGGDLAQFAAIVRDLINRLRDAGTHLRALNLLGSAIGDDFEPPTDETTLVVSSDLADSFTAPSEDMAVAGLLADMADTATAPDDAASLTITYGYTYSGARTYNGSFAHHGTASEPEAL